MSDLTSTFNSAAAGPSGEAGAVTSGPSPGGPNAPAASATFRAAAETSQSTIANATVQPEPLPVPTIENAEAELRGLEDGRATPAPRNNLNPPSNVKKIVDSKIERQREARIGALKAYMQFKQNEAAHEARHEHGEELEFGL